MEEVQKLTDRVGQIESEFRTEEIDTIVSLKSSTYQVERRIKVGLESDQVDMELGKKMDDYKLMRKQLGQLSKQGSQLRRSIKEEKEQLEKLRSDIEQGFGKRESYKNYINFEKKKVDQIGTLLDDYKRLKQGFLKTYNTLHKELLEFSLSLNRES